MLDRDLRLRVTTSDGDGSLIAMTARYHVLEPYPEEWRSAHDPAPPPPAELMKPDRCGRPGPSSDVREVRLPTDQHEIMRQQQPNKGWLENSPVTIRVEVIAASRSGCDGGETVSGFSDWIDLHLGNGAELPTVDLVHPSPEGSIALVEAFDCDGVLRSVDVDWGDGTPVETMRWPGWNNWGGAYGCRAAGHPFYVFQFLNHDYEHPGTYRITVQARSTDGDDENEQQSATASVLHTVDPEDGGDDSSDDDPLPDGPRL